MDPFSLAEKYGLIPPEWMRPVVWGILTTVLVKRLWASAWGLKERYARQDATEAKVGVLETRVTDVHKALDSRINGLSRRDKRKGLKIALLIQAKIDAERRADEISEQLAKIHALLMERSS